MAKEVLKKVKKDGRFVTIHTVEKTLKHHIVEWGATALSLAGSIINAKMYIDGFYVWGVANILWMIFAAKYKHWGLFVQNLVFLGINVYGFIGWTTNGGYNSFLG